VRERKAVTRAEPEDESTSGPVAPRAPSLRYMFGQPVRLWLYVGLLVAGGLAIVLGPLRLAPPIASSQVPAIPWWVVALLAAAGELASIELPIRRTNVVLSLNDAVIVIALMGTSPYVTILAVALSLGIVQAARRHKAEQVIFNFGAQLVTTPLYYVVLRVMVEPGAIFSLRSVAGYLIAVTLVSGVSNIEVLAAMYLSEADASVIREGLVFSTAAGALIALGTAVIAMIILVMIVAAPVVLLTLPIPILLTVAAYRAQIARRRQQTDIENLFAASRILNHSESVTAGAVDFLSHVAAMFHATLVELTLLPPAPENPALVTRTVDGVAVEVMATTPVESLPTGLAEALATSDILVTRRLGLGTPLARYLATGDRPMAMGVALPGSDDNRSLGYLVVGQRNKFVGDFQRTDLQLLGTLAEQFASALQNGRLHEDLAQLAGAQDELERKALHDPLTGLANRALIVEHAESAFHRAKRTGDLIFVLYVDLDGFKTVNDTLGHDAGDELLIKVAARLNECVRDTDTVARVGGDEFAILLEQAASLPAVEGVAQRIVEQIAGPFVLASGTANIGASVGIAYGNTAGQSVAQLMKSADAAMYVAKKSGKGRHSVSI
jgi:diguanylate cyclase (GGDEF)-like protein